MLPFFSVLPCRDEEMSAPFKAKENDLDKIVPATKGKIEDTQLTE